MPARRSPLRVGIAGAGFMGEAHARAALLAGGRLAGIAASTPDRSTDAAQRLGVERPYESAEALVTADDIDVVHICTPNDLHAPLAQAALAAGKHVICEKPLALTAEQAHGLDDAAGASGRVATVPFVYRYHPVVREARDRILSGAVGALRLVHGGYLQDWLSTAGDDNWRVDPARGGASRAFADIGSHWFDLLEFVTGERVAAVCAQTATVVPERHGAVRTEDAAAVLFRLGSGVIGTMLVSQVSPGRKNHLHVELACADATLRFEQERPETLWVGERSGTREILRDPETLGPDAARLAFLPAGHPQGYADCFDAFVADSYAAIGGADPTGLPRFGDGARSADIVDAVLRSAADGAWTEVSS